MQPHERIGRARSAAALILAIATLASLARARGHWETLPSIQWGRFGHGVVRVNDQVYVIGGANWDACAFNPDSVEVMDPTTGERDRGADMPLERGYTGATAFGEYIYVIGGMVGGWEGRGDNQRYDPQNDVWTVLEPMPTPRGMHAVIAHENRIDAIGGVEDWESGRVEIFDPLTGRWSRGADMPVALMGITAVPWDGGILIPGGGWFYGWNLDDVQTYYPDRAQGVMPFCACVGTGACGNRKSGAGCRNSTGQGGVLSADGTTSLVADDLVLTASRLPAHQLAVLWLGATQVDLAFGDGRRCVGSEPGGFFRYAAASASAHGSMMLGPGLFAGASGCGTCAFTPGSTWNFQLAYRDPFGPCGAGLNATNALAVTLAP